MTHDHPTGHDPASLAGPDRLARELEGATPAQAYRIGVACGRLLALLESLNRRLDSHLLRLGIPQEQINTATTKEEK